jgi:hypothetical protein
MSDENEKLTKSDIATFILMVVSLIMMVATTFRILFLGS